ncbi:STM3941 family protein [Mucilaginibacter litoreus]|uniref:STM3941 family protein n=1 Tax=Mucilaginibacter litoreus TaxID=1048221 RepID=A0ABW3AR68_9SPHI
MQKITSPLDIIEIPLRKTRLILALTGAALLVLLGIWLVNKPGTHQSASLLISIAEYADIIIFALIGLYILNKILEAGPGLMIDADGITDNSSVFAVGFVPWEDVTGINKKQLSSGEIIVVMVTDINGYIRRQPNALARRTASTNNRSCGSPVVIAAKALIYDFEELYSLLTDQWKQSQERQIRISSSSTDLRSPSGNGDAPVAGL